MAKLRPRAPVTPVAKRNQPTLLERILGRPGETPQPPPAALPVQPTVLEANYLGLPTPPPAPQVEVGQTNIDADPVYEVQRHTRPLGAVPVPIYPPRTMRPTVLTKRATAPTIPPLSRDPADNTEEVILPPFEHMPSQTRLYAVLLGVAVALGLYILAGLLGLT